MSTPGEREAAELCARHGIDDINDKGSVGFDGAPFELLDRGDDACEGHRWFSHVWSWGMGRIRAGDVFEGCPMADNHVPYPTVDGDTKYTRKSRQEIRDLRDMSDYRFYVMVQQTSSQQASNMMKVRRGPLAQA